MIVPVYNIEGEKVGEMELRDDIFNVEVDPAVLYQVVQMQLANRRQGTQSAKTRGEVRGGGRKPWRQKGTGRARQGSIRAPQWIKGGVVFAPKPRDYSFTLPKKLRRLAMKGALSSKVADDELIILDNISLERPKTKEMARIFKNLNADRKILMVLAEKDENIQKSSRNIPGVKTALVNTLNVYDILNCDKFIITKDAMAKVEEVYA